MAKRNYDEIAAQIVELVGGKENISSFSHCATRLRFQLKDRSLASEEKVKQLAGVAGVMVNTGGFQVVIGTDVENYFNSVMKLVPEITDTKLVEEDVGDKKGFFGQIIPTITAIFGPYIPLFLTYGVINGVITVLANYGLMDNTSATYQIFYAMSQSVLYFFPILLGFTAAKQFGGNPYIGSVIGGVLVYPGISQFLTNGAQFSFLGLNVTGVTFSGTVLPIIAAMWIYSILDKWLRKHMPKIISFLLIPIIDVVVTVAITLIVIGPVMNFIANGILAGYAWLSQFNHIVFTLICGAGYMFLVLVGFHWVLFPFQIQYLVESGQDWCFPAASTALWALIGVAIAVALTTKDREHKETAITSAAVAFLSGISEPVMYGVMLKDKFYTLMMVLGGALGGLICGINSCYNVQFGAGGIIGLPGYVPMNNFGWYIVAIISATLFGFVVTFIRNKRKAAKERK